jgi:ABC-type antimicrobial peptide transport system permease subunit
MGYTLHILPANAENFWISAESILQTVNFNMVMFSILSLSVLGLVVFIFVYSRRKDAYIMWALGCKRAKVWLRLVICLLVFAVPSFAIGSIAARPFGQQAAESTIYASFTDMGEC